MGTNFCCQIFTQRSTEDTIYRDLESEVERKLLIRALNKLSNREKLIVKMRFGLDNPEGTGKDPERSGRHAGNLPVLYIQAGEKNHAAAEAGNGAL